MTPFEYLTKQDKRTIRNYIISYGADPDFISPKEPIASLDYILRFWNKEKKDIFHAFGDKLILEKEVNINKSDRLLVQELRDFINDKKHDFITNFNKAFYSTGNAGQFINSHQDNVYLNFHILSLLDSNLLKNNKYDGKPFNIPLPSGKSLKVLYGMKITKILSKLAKEFNIEGYESFRIKHSQILNQKKLKGTLCLSIHPIDYMTMSDNDCGWSSCMSWKDEGCFRQGTVEMMNSPCVVMAYLKAKNNVRENGCEYSNKKWRELFIVHDNILCNIKGYPYKNDELTMLSLKWLKEIFNKEYENDLFTFNIYETSKYGNGYIEISPLTNCMYNDFDRVPTYGYIGKNTKTRGTVEFSYSGQSECMWCGETNNIRENAVLCYKCQLKEYCYCCCEKINLPYENVQKYMVDGLPLCKQCYKEQTEICSLTKERHLKDHMRKLYIRGIDDYYWISYDCVDTWDDEFLPEFSYILKKNTFDVENYYEKIIIDKENLTEKGLKLFNLI